MEIECTKVTVIPSSEEEVQLLDRILDIVSKMQYILKKDILELCNGDEDLCNKTIYCLTDTEAVKESHNMLGTYRIHPENTIKYIDIDYYRHLYEDRKKKKERDELEFAKLQDEVKICKQQASLSKPAFYISIAAIIFQLLSLVLTLI